VTRTLLLGAVSALTIAGAAQAQSDIARGAPRLTAPTGHPFVSVITIDRDGGGLQLCGKTQWSGEAPVCGPLPVQSEEEETERLVPKRQSLLPL
jgi:hypothetical protein